MTLSILIGVIKILVSWMPYEGSLPKTERYLPIGDEETGEHVAIIHTAISYYLGINPEKIQVTDIKSLQ